MPTRPAAQLMHEDDDVDPEEEVDVPEKRYRRILKRYCRILKFTRAVKFFLLFVPITCRTWRTSTLGGRGREES